MNRVCLGCYRDLPQPVSLEQPVVCECGLAYSVPLLVMCPPDVWAGVLRREGVKVGYNDDGLHIVWL